jgi:hypothetical protein
MQQNSERTIVADGSAFDVYSYPRLQQTVPRVAIVRPVDTDPNESTVLGVRIASCRHPWRWDGERPDNRLEGVLY